MRTRSRKHGTKQECKTGCPPGTLGQVGGTGPTITYGWRMDVEVRVKYDGLMRPLESVCWDQRPSTQAQH